MNLATHGPVPIVPPHRDTHVLFRRKELKALVDMHGADEGLGGKLSDDEVQIITGALDLTHKVGLGTFHS